MAVKKAQTTAKPPTKSSKKNAKPANGTNESFYTVASNFFRDGRTRLVLAAMSIFFALFIFVAFISYLSNGPIDQSTPYEKGYIENPDIQVQNSSGKIGASIAHFFIYEGFGIPSFSVVFILVLFSLYLTKINLLPIGKSLKYIITGTIWLSVALSFIFGETQQYMGGAHGYFISRWLVSTMGSLGTIFILVISLAAFVLFTFKQSYDWIQSKLQVDKFKTQQGPTEVSENTEVSNSNIDFTDDVDVETNLKSGIDLDTNELIGTVERKHILLHDDGQEVDKTDLGFEVENTVNENVEGTDPLSGLVLNVEKNQDIETDEVFDFPEDYDPTLELSNYKSPPLDLLDDHRSADSIVTNEELLQNKNKIVETLRNYKIEIVRIKATIGPTITLYEIVPAPGVRISKIKNLEDDIALSLAALGIRIIAPMPGRGTIGIEVPNLKPEIVSMRSVISSLKFQESKYELPLALGKTISNESYVVDLTKMPHLLVAGATGQGKSVGLNAIITSLLYKKHPSQLKFIFVDPKKVELTLYEKIEKHFLAKLPDSKEAIITENMQVVHTLNSLSKEMDNRYNLLKNAQVRNIKEYNEKFISRRLNPRKGHKFLPYLILVIDEFADLIITAGKEVEMPIARLAQLSRAVGIHLIIATQRPSTNIITGVIKANFPTRLAFKVASMVDSRTILDSPGANQLIGRGDMLITEGSELVRLQCAYIDTGELDKITSFIFSQQSYPSAFLLPEPDSEGSEEMEDVDLSKLDDLFEEAARIVVVHQQGSTSLIQRKLSIGYNRAGRIIDQLEAAGIVGPFEGSKARQVLITDEYALEQFLKNLRV
ncbi:MAG: DNA translocase FtsK 4TM domain-containing protein [Bacteroidales bacterium]